MHTEHSHEKNTNYFPIIIIVVVLGLITWALLHNFKGEGSGYMWAGETTAKAAHEGHENQEGESHEAKGKMEESTMTVSPEALGKLDTLSGNFIYNTGTEKEWALPDGTKVMAGENSSEAKLVHFLSDEKTMVDSVDKTKGWISLDRFYFETGKAVVTPQSATQMKNIAAILKAFPTATIKIGGYTDNTGSEDANMKLSDSRAKAAMSSLVSAGTAAGRIAAEGYGKEHPIAENTSAEGKALNRRIDIRVTKK